MDLLILTATVADAREILALQKLAFRSEAELYNDWSIPPLTQTLEDIQAQFKDHTFLKAIKGAQIVGSVRARLEEGTCQIGRLIVNPEWQRCGIGTQLMHQIERRFARAQQFEVYTGSRSEGNIRLYARLGYEACVNLAVSPRVTLVYMRKKQKADQHDPGSE